MGECGSSDPGVPSTPSSACTVYGGVVAGSVHLGWVSAFLEVAGAVSGCGTG